MGMTIKRPKEWNIRIWKENEMWHEEYVEYFPDNEENRLARKMTVPLFKPVFQKIGFIDLEMEDIDKDDMIGVKIIFHAKEIEKIADQIVSEFLFITSMGDISLKDLLQGCLKNTVLEDYKVVEDEDKK